MNSNASVLDFPVSLADVDAAIRLKERRKIDSYFPDTGDRRRELYPKQMEFFECGAEFKERLFMAANRVGKTTGGAFETTCHLTGRYPSWWKGRRFSEATEGWACGTSTETTRDIVQRELLGKFSEIGTGMIPGDLIVDRTLRRGVSNAIESLWVKHITGKYSVLGLKTYEQGRESFEGTAKHFLWCDEEPPLDCYTEMVYRTITVRGIMYVTFTPLKGMSEVVKSFVEPESPDSRLYKRVIQAGWKDVPHLDEAEKKNLLATTPPYQIQARTEGEPTLGAGAIYPIAESEITCPPREIPDTWPRAYGMDVGWERTAVIWGARDPGTGVIYLYSEHYQGQGEPSSHALGIKARGDWVPGVIDPAANGRSQIDGRELLTMYGRLGLKLEPAVNAVETGITEVWQLLVAGKLKVFSNCQNWFREFRKYHRDDKGSGKIVDTADHLMDATRYLIVSGRNRMKIKPAKPEPEQRSCDPGSRSGAWMG